ncbi:hypothetical protein HA402_009435 [Bradysia odoriphaga]|nr:hypothetical protein HA402_009435 [Bradysia odoriphaga]
MTKYISVLVMWLQCLLFVTDADSYLGSLSPTSAPYFDKTASPNVTIIIDNTAELNCRISNLGDRTVVWVRHRDIHLLTVNQLTYTSDERFSSIHNPDTDVWSLQIKNVRSSDSGIYECQVASTIAYITLKRHCFNNTHNIQFQGTTPAVGIPIYLTVVGKDL